MEPESVSFGFSEAAVGVGGLRKQVLRKGESWQSPFPGDEVVVRYIGWIEGSGRVEPWSDGECYKFKLGQGEVIKGWDQGIATMKKGERAIFTVPPDLAYAEAGLPPLIPPDSTLMFDIEILSWTSIRDLTGDGGVLKRILVEGQGWATPRDDDEVLVRYKVKLQDGTLVSSSSEGVEFRVGRGFLCPAIGIATKTMRKQEKAELTVKFTYGIPQSYSRSKANCGSMLEDVDMVIQIELLSWKSVIDVTGDKRVIKKIVKAGEGFAHPKEGSAVKVVYTCRSKEGSILKECGSAEKPHLYVLFDEQANEDMDKAVATMRKGEQATVTFQRNSSLSYEIELVDFAKGKPLWRMTSKEKLETCERRKAEGNSLFERGDFSGASQKYEKAVKCIEFDHSFSDEEKATATALRLSCYLNNAACKLRLSAYHEATRLCTKVLELDSGNIKALYRRSQANLKISNLGEARTDVQRALIIQPHNREVKLVYEELKEKQRVHKVYEAEFSRTILSRMV
ncbi:hypothetical protein MLD38_015913 [Melastoma candidum]|uniref:Uncharacterized protein n=1 Tax=Melastoma candidum TaxID=119954 RepID=A0ACB9RHK0_9MYRT|nr:hypothetical protein MLD38_015913 [Melastoma candidum]